MPRPRKITQEQLDSIYELEKAGKNYYAIAKELNLNHGSVRYFLLCKNAVKTMKEAEPIKEPQEVVSNGQA